MDMIQWDGQPITAPGIFVGIDLPTYHLQLTDAPSISSSGLRTIEAESCLHFWTGSYLDPDREQEDPKPHFSLGTAVHMLLMGESGFRSKFAVRPEKWKDWRTDAAKAWRDETYAAGMDVLTLDDLEVIKGIARSVAAEPLIQSGLFSGIPEASMVWKDPETGVWLKSRPDQLVLGDQPTLVDLKTIASADGQSCRRSIADYAYHVQLALAAEGFEILTGRQMPNDGCLLLFVEKKRPFAVNLKPISAEAIYRGRSLVRRAVRKFAKCVETGVWPGYEDSGVTAHLPGWLDKRLGEEADAGLLPDPLITIPNRRAAAWTPAAAAPATMPARPGR